jgi:X-Pro dipeptidyl-peptidase
VADVIGTRNSSGCWDYGGPKEQQSGVDVVNFLAAQPWSNGKVAMIGTSYDGTTANMVAARAKDAPGLAAIVPIAAISRWYGYAYSHGIRFAGNSRNPADEGVDTPLAFDFGFALHPPTDPGAYPDAFLDRMTPCGRDEHTVKGYDTSPDYDDFWLDRDYRKDAAKFTVPTLVAHGWQDWNVKQEEALGLWNALTPNTPWRGLYVWQARHATPGGSEWNDMLNAFFDRYLKGDTKAPLPPSGKVYTQPRDAAGSLDLESPASFPPPRTGELELKLGRADAGTLGGKGGGEPVTYTDPATGEEETYQEDAGAETFWRTYTSEPLTDDARIAGSVLLDLEMQASRNSGHLTPLLFDVPPSGTPVVISRGWQNLRYKDGLAKEQPVPVDETFRAVVEFNPQDWVVRKGHKIMVVVASSNAAWSVPDAPGLTVEIRHENSRLLAPIVGIGSDPKPASPIPGGVKPAEPIPARAAAKLSLKVKGAKRALKVSGKATKGVKVALKVLRGKKTVAKRTVTARTGAFKATIKVKKAGRYKVVASVRTRDGLVTRSRSAKAR